MPDYYKPEQDGIAGLEEFGEVEHGTNYEDIDDVYVGGIRLIGRTYEPELVEDFLVERGIAPTVRVDKVHCSPNAPSTIATRADVRRGWRYEASKGLPDHMRGPTLVADGALRFAPGWDDSRAPRVLPDTLYVQDGEYCEYCVSRGIYNRGRTAGWADDVEEGNNQS
jgi:hypothetical protein